jgi:hypothetical protein
MKRSCEPRTSGPFSARGGPLNSSDAAVARKAAAEVKKELARL